MLNEYKRQLQGPHSGPDWVKLSPTVSERAEWITPRLLEDLLGDRLVKTAVIRDLNTTEQQVSQQLLRARGDYVAIANTSGAIEQVVSRQRFLDRTARLFADLG